MKQRITYLDGLKPVMCYLIMLMHYCLAYMPGGFIGYGSGIAEADMAAAFNAGLPLSLFTNTTLELYVFFGLISMIATIAFYSSGDPHKFLESQATKRYFRFVIPVAAAVLMTYFLHEAGLLQYRGVYELSGSRWNLAVEAADVPWPEAVYIAFIKCFFAGNTGILSALWCMDLIFIGSLLTYGFLAVMGHSRGRCAVYVAGALLFIPFPKYAVFFAGIICGDLFANRLKSIAVSGLRRELIAMALVLGGIALGLIPSVYVSAPFSLEYTYAVATALLLCGVILSGALQRLLSAKWLVSQSRYAFALLLVQFQVMYGVSYYVMRLLLSLTGRYTLSFCATFLLCAGITHLAAIGFYRLFEKPSAKLADYVCRRLIG